MSISVTYTGTAGPGMTATIEDKGSIGLSIDTPDGCGEWTDVRKWLVMGPATSYDAIIALNVSGYGFNSAHPYIGSMLKCGPMKPIQKVSGGWLIQATYSRPPAGIWADTIPTNRPILINFNYSFVKIPAEIDSQGYVITNSAGDIFNPSQTIDICVAKITVLKWLSSYNGGSAQSLIGKVNASAVSLNNSITYPSGSVPARCIKCLSYAPTNSIIMTAPYVANLFEFEIKFDKYDRRILDAGFNAWYSDSSTSHTVSKGKLSAVSNLEPVPNPVLLNGAGQPLVGGLTVIDHKNGFNAFHDAPSSRLPPYMTAVRGAASDGGYILPYHVELEADFTPFVTLGL